MTVPDAQQWNVLITGAGRGIGRGLSRLFLNEGHRVFLVDNDEIELKHTIERLRKIGGKDSVEAYSCDLRDPAEIKRAVQGATTFFNGRLDCLINNAAYTTGAVGLSLFESLSIDNWTRALETNLTAPMLLSQRCLGILQKTQDRPNGGSIIMMSSTRAHQSEPNCEAYAATKAGLIGLAHAMAVSIAEKGIRVNAILPGWINASNECKIADEKGALWEEGLSEDDHRWHLTGRVGKVEDVFIAVEYLMKADFVTGTEMVVDGGVTRKMVYPDE